VRLKGNCLFIFEPMSEQSSEKQGTPDRKRDHIDMAFASSIGSDQLDHRFYYEPMLAGHPKEKASNFEFLGKEMRYPIWVSSMTGGTKWARTINHNLARMCGKHGFGMGLGSCRPLLEGKQHFKDFDVREFIGPSAPLFANIGIAQLQEMQASGTTDRLRVLMEQLRADGWIIHVNPMQEWLQPEGDRYYISPVETISRLLEDVEFPVIVKEVGHGFGPESLRALLQLPLAALDFGANGGTNFSKLEMMRSDKEKAKLYESLAFVGHSAEEMMAMSQSIVEELGSKCLCQSIIASGGVKSFLQGYYLVESSPLPAVYGQAAAFLKYARESFDAVDAYAQRQTEAYDLCRQLLTVRTS